MKLKMGCADENPEDYITIDISKISKPDVLGDVLKMPFKDNMFEEVLCENVLEHIQDTLTVMNEIWRVAKQDSIIKIVTPHASNPNFWGVPDHIKPFTYTTFDKFGPEAKNSYYGVRFKVIKKRLVPTLGFLQPLVNMFPIKMEYLASYIFGFDRIEVELTPLKN